MRILINALRRKRPSPILTDEDHTSFSSGGDHHHHHHHHEIVEEEEEDLDKENEVPTPRIGNKSSKAISSPSYNGDGIGVVGFHCAGDDDDDPTTREGIKESRDDGDDIGVELRRQSHSPDIESIYTEDFTQNSVVAYASRSRSVSDESEEESTDTNSFVASVDEVTEVSDDGVLRDDEGNPIDQTEVEEIMLRDEAGNIIDPRTLLLRDSFISDGDDEQDEEDNIDVLNYSSSWDHYLYERRSQESCIISSVSSDEILYEDEHQEVVYKNKNGIVSFVVDQGDEAADSDESIHLISSGSDDESTLGSDTIPDEENGGETASGVHNNKEEEANVQYEVDAENSKHSSCDTSSQEDGLKAPPSSPREKSAKYENEIRGRRRGRGGRCISSRHQQDEYVHVIFHNKLTTLEEEHRGDSSSDYTECNSVSEESEEQDNTAALLLAEKYIRARWEYSLQVMNLGCIGGGMSGALIDARDEINDMLRPSNTIPDDSSVEVEGEI